MAEIIVEDGTGLPDANSYITVAEAKAFALDRGNPVAELDDDAVSILLIRAMDYLETRFDEFVGKATFPDVQALSWPRSVTNCDETVTDFGVHKNIKTVQAFLVLALHSGVDLLPTINNARVILEEKVGPLQVKYGAGSKEGPYMSVVEGYLKGLLKLPTSGYRYSVVRV